MKTVLQNHVPHNTGWSAEMDLLVALSACPDLAVGGKPVDVMVYEE